MFMVRNSTESRISDEQSPDALLFVGLKVHAGAGTSRSAP